MRVEKRGQGGRNKLCEATQLQFAPCLKTEAASYLGVVDEVENGLPECCPAVSTSHGDAALGYHMRVQDRSRIVYAA